MATVRGTLHSFWSKKPQPKNEIICCSLDANQQDTPQGGKDDAPTDGGPHKKTEDTQAQPQDMQLCGTFLVTNTPQVIPASVAGSPAARIPCLLAQHSDSRGYGPRSQGELICRVNY